MIQIRLKTAFNTFYLFLLWVFVSLSFFRNTLDSRELPLALMAAGLLLTLCFLLLNRQELRSVMNRSFSAPDPQCTNNSGAAPKTDGTERGRKIHLICVALLVIAAGIMFSYRIGATDFWDDEYLVLKAAEGFRQTGAFFEWDFIRDKPTDREYSRAWPHTWLVAQAYRIFGVSEWSTRIVSVLFGVIFTGASFFIIHYFSANALFSFLTAVVFLVNPYFLFYWRYSRMYALLLPLFFTLSAFALKAIEGDPSAPPLKRARNFGIQEVFNLNYTHAALAIFLFFWAYHIHINSLIIGLVLFIYIMLTAVFWQEKKYILLTALSCAAMPVVFLLMPGKTISKITAMIGFFEVYHPVYFRLMALKPFLPPLNLVLLAASLIIIAIAQPTINKKRLFYCSIYVVAALIFFVFMADYYGRHFRYISHIMPFAILLICFAYLVILKVYRHKAVLVIGTGLLIATQAYDLTIAAKDLVHGLPEQPRPSIAYATIVENLRHGEVIFGQYLRDYYLQGIGEDTVLISLGSIRRDVRGTNPYKFNDFYRDLIRHKKGWIVWQSYKQYNIDRKIVAYVKTLFKQYHGKDLDDTGVEVYYFDEQMIKRANFTN
jgi:hypothetical protein